MGTWGTAIFSDDLACDIRAQFRELIGDGLSPDEATDQVIAGYSANGVVDDDEAPVFWLALAATQWKCGRLVERVRNEAIRTIDSGAGLARWDGASKTGAVAKRRAVLAALREQLLSPQPKPSKIRKVYHDRTEWELGHLVSYRLTSGKLVDLRVIGIDEHAKDRTAIVDLCDWVGETLPPVTELIRLPRRRTKKYAQTQWQEDGKFTVYSLGPRDFPADRVSVIATKQNVEPGNRMGVTYFGGWRKLDDFLLTHFDIS